MNKEINVIDIETYGSAFLTPYCCSIIFKGLKLTSYGLDCVQKTLAYIHTHQGSRTVFFAHNLTFDGGLILTCLDSSWSVSDKLTCLKGGSIYSLALVKDQKTLIFRCSSKILPDDLSSIAKKLNLPNKLSMDHSKITNLNFLDTSIKNEVIAYCIRDTEIVNKFMNKIDLSLKKYLNNWWFLNYSISGISLRLFKELFNFCNISLSIDFKTDELIREAYYGGRCEVFGNPLDDEKIFHFDFTGMYTQRLAEEYPIGEGCFEPNPGTCLSVGFYSVSVYSNLSLPILPYRCKKTNKLLFPNGCFSGVYWYEELLLFIDAGGIIKKIFWGYTWKESGLPFKNFADFCAKKRLDSQLDKMLWKIIPNSFIGRLGIRPEYEKTVILKDSEYDPRLLNVISDKKINNIWIVRMRDFSKKDIHGNVIYAAIVTSKARILWWKSAIEVIKNNGRLLYCDTDSIFASFKKDVSGEKHGEIYWDPSKSDTVINKACFACSKAYSIVNNKESITKIKGIPKKSIKISFEEFSKLFYNNEKISVKIDFFRKNNYMMRIDEINKITNFNFYDKRIFDSTKKFTQPLNITEDTLYNE